MRPRPFLGLDLLAGPVEPVIDLSLLDELNSSNSGQSGLQSVLGSLHLANMGQTTDLGRDPTLVGLERVSHDNLATGLGCQLKLLLKCGEAELKAHRATWK